MSRTTGGGLRAFMIRRPDPPVARPDDVEEAVRERLYGGRSQLAVRPRPRATAPP